MLINSKNIQRIACQFEIVDFFVGFGFYGFSWVCVNICDSETW